MTDKVTHHAVEEEARLMRVIMQKAKDESPESIRIMQEHNGVMNFFKNKLGAIRSGSNSKIDSQIQGDDYADKNQQSKKELNEFVTNLRSHFYEEEQIVFPLALRANFIMITSNSNVSSSMNYHYPWFITNDIIKCGLQISTELIQMSILTNSSRFYHHQ